MRRNRWKLKDIAIVTVITAATLAVTVAVGLGCIHLFVDVLKAIIHDKPF